MSSIERRTKLSHLPKSPGVYFMKDVQGKVVYVGKAKDLRSRVSSYFGSNKEQTPKTRKLVRQIVDFEVILVQNEVEALLLERTLIKHHQPPFNILLRDDKEYPYIRIHFGDPWPRLDVVRRRKDDGAEYFGPFSAPGSLRQGLEAIKRVFPIIRCSPWEFKNAKRVCNYYHMKMCLGPCVIPVAQEAYHNMLRAAMALIQGKNQEVIADLSKRMENASHLEQYEMAAQYRDQIRSIDSLKEKQSMVLAPEFSADVIGWTRNDEVISVHVLAIRNGKVMGGDNFILKDQGSEDDQESLSQFILQYYDKRDLPAKVLIPLNLSWASELAIAISKGSGQSTELKVQKNMTREPWPGLTAIANKNAAFQLEESIRTHDQAKSSLEALQSLLGLAILPRKMECIDISNLQGTAIVASDVCFMDGNPEKSLYRGYNIKTVTGSPDDFQSIYEVVMRRIERGIRDGDLPDLLVIDGGRGQLDSALKALAAYPGLDLQIISLAKSRLEKEKGSKLTGKTSSTINSKLAGRSVNTSRPKHSLERVFMPGQPNSVPLAPGSPAYRILTRIRDEAHRFAITRHRAKRKKIAEASPLDDIPGVGPKLRVALIKNFDSLEGIRRASLGDLIKVKGISEELAVRIHSSLKV